MNKARFTGEEELRGRAAGKDPFCQMTIFFQTKLQRICSHLGPIDLPFRE